MNPSEHYVLGIDGGGTRTRALLLDTRNGTCTFGEAGPANPIYVGVDGLLTAVKAAWGQASASAGNCSHKLASCFLGIAGAGVPAVQAQITAVLQREPAFSAATIFVDHDLRTALAGGLACRPGIVVIAGTGSAGYGRNRQGQSWQSGGLGALFDDAGSAYWLGREALVSTLRTLDGRSPANGLTAALLEKIGSRDPREIARRFADLSKARAEIAEFAPLVLRLATAGAPETLHLAEHGADELALIAAAIHEKLFSSEPAEVVLVGGLARDSGYFNRVAGALGRRVSGAILRRARYEPVVGAVLLACENSGHAVAPDLRERLQHLAQSRSATRG